MINDAPALVAFRVALGAAIARHLQRSPTPALDFVVSAVGGVAIGLAAGWLEVRVAAQLDDRPLVDPAVAAVPLRRLRAAEEAHVSGVLAAVAAGLYLGWFAARVLQRRHAPERRRVLGGARLRPQRAAVPAARPAVPGDRRRRRAPATPSARCCSTAPGDRGGRGRDPAASPSFLPFTRHRRRLARAARDRLERHARRDLARRRAVGARRPSPASRRSSVRDGRRDPRHARRPGPHAARAAARSCGSRATARGPPTRRSRGWRPRSPRSTGSTSSRTRARRRGAAAPHARALPRALPRLPGRARRRRAGRRRRRARDAPPLLRPAPRADRRRARARCSACATRAGCAPTSSA